MKLMNAFLSLTLATSFLVASTISQAAIAPANLPAVALFSTNSKAPFAVDASFLSLDKKTSAVEFKKLNSDMAKKIGLLSKEEKAYNDEIGSINSAFSVMNNKMLKANHELSANAQQALLDEFRLDVSQEAFLAVQKLLNSNI